MAAKVDPELLAEGRAKACEAVRLAGRELPLRAVPIGQPDVEWSRGHLRTIYDQRFGVYERLGELHLVVDARGRLLELDDPRHQPHQPGVTFSAAAATERVAELVGLPRDTPMLRGEVEWDGTHRFIRVWTIPMGVGPQPRVEARVNAISGGIYQLRHEPVPRERPPKPKAKPKEGGAGGAGGGAGGRKSS
jgi:hypothetical protein